MTDKAREALAEPWRSLYSRLIKLGANIIQQRHWGDPIPQQAAEKQDDSLSELAMEARDIADALALAARAALAETQPSDERTLRPNEQGIQGDRGGQLRELVEKAAIHIAMPQHYRHALLDKFDRLLLKQGSSHTDPLKSC